MSGLVWANNFFPVHLCLWAGGGLRLNPMNPPGSIPEPVFPLSVACLILRHSHIYVVTKTTRQQAVFGPHNSFQFKSGSLPISFSNLCVNMLAITKMWNLHRVGHKPRLHLSSVWAKVHQILGGRRTLPFLTKISTHMSQCHHKTIWKKQFSASSYRGMAPMNFEWPFSHTSSHPNMWQRLAEFRVATSKDSIQKNIMAFHAYAQAVVTRTFSQNMLLCKCGHWWRWSH